MPQLTFIDSSGRKTFVEAEPGRSVMEYGVEEGVSGILAECGGSSACGTCQVYIEDIWSKFLPEPSDLEREMVNQPELPGRTVRLSCQIDVVKELDGMIVVVPKLQH